METRKENFDLTLRAITKTNIIDYLKWDTLEQKAREYLETRKGKKLVREYDWIINFNNEYCLIALAIVEYLEYETPKYKYII